MRSGGGTFALEVVEDVAQGQPLRRGQLVRSRPHVRHLRHHADVDPFRPLAFRPLILHRQLGQGRLGLQRPQRMTGANPFHGDQVRQRRRRAIARAQHPLLVTLVVPRLARQLDDAHLILEMTDLQSRIDGRHPGAVAGDEDLDAERPQGAGQEQGAEGTVRFAAGRIAMRDVKARDHQHLGLGRLGDAAASVREVIGTRVDQVADGIGAQTAPANVFLDQVAQTLEQGSRHRGSPNS